MKGFFSEKSVSASFYPLLTPHFMQKNQKNLMTQFSSKSQKPHFGVILDPFCPKKGLRDFFFKNRAPSVFIIYGPLTSCKKSEKSNKPILRKLTNERTNGRTDRGHFLGPLNFVRVQNQKKIMSQF